MLNPTDIHPRSQMPIEGMDRKGISPAGIFLATVLLWLIPLSIWAYATRPHAASAPNGQASGPTIIEADRAQGSKP